jgi:hypothetical protein
MMKTVLILASLLLTLPACSSTSKPTPTQTQAAVEQLRPSPASHLTRTLTPTLAPTPASTAMPTADATAGHTSSSTQDQIEEFAYVGLDGNVYLYSIEAQTHEQLTFDGEPTQHHRERLSQCYRFLGEPPEKTWSSDDNILLGKAETIYVLNANTGQAQSLGEFDQALWSPLGKSIALVDLAMAYDEDDNDNIIVILDAFSFQERATIEGQAPDWLSEDRLIFLSRGSAPKYSSSPYYVHQYLQVFDLESHVVTRLNAELEKFGSTARISRLSADNKFIAVYAPGMEFQTDIALMELDSFEVFDMKWDIRNDYSGDGFAWSPVDPILAFCKAVTGSEAPDEFLGLVLDRWGEEPFLAGKGCHFWTRPSWNPTGDLIAYLQYPSRKSLQVSIVGNNGTEFVASQPLAVSDDYKVHGPMWSPDGKYMTAVVDNKIYMALVPKPILVFETIADGMGGHKTDIAWVAEHDFVFDYIADGVDVLWHP